MFCCTTDVVTRVLPNTNNVRFPEEQKRLLLLMRQDQEERSSKTFFTQDQQQARKLQSREDSRAREVLRILEIIKTPSVQNVGLDGSRAIWLIALHNINYDNLGQRVLSKMRRLYSKDADTVFYPGIPYLTDRIRISRQNHDHAATQLFGTQMWQSVDNDDGKTEKGIFPIVQRSSLNARRRRYSLFPLSPELARCKHNAK